MIRKAPPLRSLYVFSVAARHQSFKLAADELFVTPQAVSLQIKALEEQLELTLFERKPAAIHLTASGEKLLGYVQRGIELIELGIDDVKRSNERQQFKVSSSPWFAINILLPVINEFEIRYPDVDIQVTTAIQCPDFELNRLDLAIQWGFGQWDMSNQMLLLPDDKLLVCAPDLQRGGGKIHCANDLKKHRLLCTDLSIELWNKFLNTLGVDALVDQQVLPLDSHAGMLNAVERGLGVAMISAEEALQGCREGRLVAPLGEQRLSQINPSLVPGYWLLGKAVTADNALAAEFSTWLLDVIKRR